MNLRHLFSEWRTRLLLWQETASDVASGQRWIASIRVRILKFLINRYADAPPTEPGVAIPMPARRSRRMPPPIQYWADVQADGPPPRSSEQIGSILHDIRRCNRPPRRRPWFVWG